MPKNKGKGGKKFKRFKHDNESKRPLVLKEEDQCYAKVTKMLGSGRLMADCYIENKDKSIENMEMKNVMCIIRGSMRKRVWINIGDIVLVSIRDFQDSKADIVYKYETDEIPKLVQENQLPNLETFNSIDDIIMEDSNDNSINKNTYFEFDENNSDNDSDQNEDISYE